MKKSLSTPHFASIFAPVAIGFILVSALLAGTTPTVDAQAYYGNYISPAAYQNQSCISLTQYQQLGSTDAYTGGQVTLLQEFLNQTGYLSGVSGTFDNGTLGAVINFQRAYGIQITGTVGPITQSLINQQSCGSGVAVPGYGVSNTGLYNQPSYSYPVTNYQNGNNCYWTGGTYNSTYVCSNSSVIPAVPVAPIYQSPVICNNYNNNGYGNYNNGYNYGSNYNNCNRVEIDSLTAATSYNGIVTLTIKGYGFSSTGNTVYFGNTVIANAVSSNGTSITVNVPTGYYTGTYGVLVKNAAGISTNTLSYIMSGASNYWSNTWNNAWNNNGNNNGNSNYNNNNNYYNSAPSLSNISGPSAVQAGVLNTWTVTTNGSNNSNATVSVTWGDNNYANGNSTQTSYSSNGQTFSFSHVYQTGGNYTVRITATNSAGMTSYSTYSVTVNGPNNYNYYNNNSGSYNYSYSY
jgi:hypothetical protein